MRAFYVEGLGWQAANDFGDDGISFDLGGYAALNFYPRVQLTRDTRLESSPARAALTLAYLAREAERVDEIMHTAEQAGGTIVKAPAETSWGGYAGYFADPEGYVWEIDTPGGYERYVAE